MKILALCLLIAVTLSTFGPAKSNSGIKWSALSAAANRNDRHHRHSYNKPQQVYNRFPYLSNLRPNPINVVLAPAAPTITTSVLPSQLISTPILSNPVIPNPLISLPNLLNTNTVSTFPNILTQTPTTTTTPNPLLPNLISTTPNLLVPTPRQIRSLNITNNYQLPVTVTVTFSSGVTQSYSVNSYTTGQISREINMGTYNTVDTISSFSFSVNGLVLGSGSSADANGVENRGYTVSSTGTVTRTC